MHRPIVVETNKPKYFLRKISPRIYMVRYVLWWHPYCEPARYCWRWQRFIQELPTPTRTKLLARPRSKSPGSWGGQWGASSSSVVVCHRHPFVGSLASLASCTGQITAGYKDTGLPLSSARVSTVPGQVNGLVVNLHFCLGTIGTGIANRRRFIVPCLVCLSITSIAVIICMAERWLKGNIIREFN